MVEGRMLTICSIQTQGHVIVCTAQTVSCSVCKLGMLSPDDVLGAAADAPREMESV